MCAVYIKPKREKPKPKREKPELSPQNPEYVRVRRMAQIGLDQLSRDCVIEHVKPDI